MLLFLLMDYRRIDLGGVLMTVKKAIKLLDKEYWFTISKLENLYDARHEVTWQGDVDDIDSDIQFYETRLESITNALDELKSLVVVR